MPIFVWWIIAACIALLATRVAVDDKTPVEQVTEPVRQVLGTGLETIGYGILIALVILAVGYAVRAVRKE